MNLRILELANSYFELDEDNIHAKEMDFKSLYDEYNRKYFHSMLPDIPIELSSRMKKSGGVAHAVREGSMYKPTRIQISTYFLKHPDQYKGILLHEMAHVYMYVTHTAIDYHRKFKNDAHGIEFQQLLKKLGDASGIKVPLKDSIEDVDVA